MIQAHLTLPTTTPFGFLAQIKQHKNRDPTKSISNIKPRIINLH